MRESLRFLAAFLRRPGSVGSVLPSSAALSRAMVAGIAAGRGGSILEFGPGTGPVTAEILKALARPGHGPLRRSYLGIEREPSFVRLLRRRFPRARFVAASAEDAEAECRKAGLAPVQAVISSLPFASLPAGVQDGVIRCLGRLVRRGCEFRTYQYVHAYLLPAASRFRRRLDDRLGRHRRLAVIAGNVPPAFVLSWRRPSTR